MNLTGNTINLNFPTLAVSGVSQYNIKTFSRYRITCLKVLTYHLLLNYLGSMGVLSGTNKIIFIYLRPRYYYMYCFQYSSVGRHSVVVSLIYTVWKITVVFLPLSFGCFVAVWPWCICTDIYPDFTQAYFSYNMRSPIPFNPGTNLAHLIATLWHRLGIYYTL